MGIEGYYEDYFDERQQDEKLTNFQKIKNMSLDEMAEFIRKVDCKNACAFYDTVDCSCFECFDGIEQWLQEESER